jgi:hypothetical protein
MRRRGILAAAVALVAAAALVPTAAQADPSFYATPMFGIDPAPGGQLLVADAGKASWTPIRGRSWLRFRA